MSNFHREQELDELLKYYISGNTSEQDMVEWALLNTFSSLKKKLVEGDREWATASFLASIKRARNLMPEDKVKMINLLDDIITYLSGICKLEETTYPDLGSKKDIKKDMQSYTNFLSSERELDELLKYYMSSDKSEQNIVEWALLTTLGSLKQKLQEGDHEWATPSFLESLKRARNLMLKDKVKMINLLDDIITYLSDII